MKDRKNVKVVIMAGGKGTRIVSINDEVPKPMIPIAGKPILEHQIECLVKQKLKEIIIVIGYKGEVIQNYFEDGKRFGVNIKYIREETPLGTAGALYYLKEKINEDFFLINGDIIFDIDFCRFYQYHKRNGSYATIFTHPNSHPHDSSIVVADENGKVTCWHSKEEDRGWYKNCVNAGIHLLSPEIFKMFPVLEKKDLDRDILKSLIKQDKLYSYQSPEYVKDIGTPERFFSVQEELKKGLITTKNLTKKQRAIFLDRDGTINKYVGFLKNIEDMELLHGVSEAIRKINTSDFLAIVITNQPVIARGEVTYKELEDIHNKMETLLGKEGAYIDDIFFCPHHPDKGYEGEREELKVECNCRKPKPGLLIKAAEKYNIDLKESWMVGDSINDITAGRAVGCKTAFIGKLDENGVPAFNNLLECIDKILG